MTTPSRHRPRALRTLLLAAAAALTLGLSACGYPAEGEIEFYVEGDCGHGCGYEYEYGYDDCHDHGCGYHDCHPHGCHASYPVTVDLYASDFRDGYLDAFDVVHRHEGLEVTEDGSISFVDFDLDAIPHGARILWAELTLVDVAYTSFGGPVDLDVSTVAYGSTLDPGDGGIPGSDTRTFGLGPGAAGAAVVLDVTSLLATELDRGAHRFQLRLDAFGGHLLFEDAGSNLGTGGVPVLGIGYD